MEADWKLDLLTCAGCFMLASGPACNPVTDTSQALVAHVLSNGACVLALGDGQALGIRQEHTTMGQAWPLSRSCHGVRSLG